jgi:ferrous iron transport protein B
VRQFAELIRNLPGLRKVSAESEALLTLSDSRPENLESYTAEVRTSIPQARERLKQVGIDWRSVAIEARYACIGRIYRNCVVETEMLQESFSDKLDRVVTHRVWGMLLFLVIMAVMFQSIFTFAAVPMELISNLVDGLGKWVESALPPGALTDLIVNGVIAGVGAVVVFLPQILLLFLFISLLEDTGYMARAAFIMDRLMSKVGLHGKSFIPMLSSFACAIPGIMATRTIESPKDRLATILIAPLMSCSARLPVYAVLIACCIPDKRVLGIFKLTGLTMLGMYLLGVVVALAMAWVFKRTLAKGVTPLLIMELPAYKRPVLTVILRHMWDRGKMFLQQAGTVILGINIILWFLTTYPHNSQVRQEFAERESQVVRTTLPSTAPAPAVIAKVEELKKQFAHQAPATNDPLFAMYEQFQTLEREERSARLQHSFAGRFGRLFEPFIAPLGFDWKMGIGIFASFAAREVFVSTMSIIYSAESGDGDNANEGLVKTMQQQRHRDGTLVYTTLTGITLMVFYVLALQCASTIAVVKRETGSWKWPIFQWCYMGVLAWVFAFITYQGGKLLGWG